MNSVTRRLIKVAGMSEVQAAAVVVVVPRLLKTRQGKIARERARAVLEAVEVPMKDAVICVQHWLHVQDDLSAEEVLIGSWMLYLLAHISML